MRKMDLFKITFFALIIFSFLVSACTPRPPQATLTSDQIDFGDVIMGEEVSQQVSLTNNGGEPLEILSISTSCGCTTASINQMIIPPGETATLLIEFDSGAHGIEDLVPLFRQVFIATNDPQQPEVVIDITANVVSITPES